MKWLSRVRFPLLALAGLCLTASLCLAQGQDEPGRERRGRGGAGGQGGFGAGGFGQGGFGAGGFGGFGGFGGGFPMMTLATNAAVQKDLELTQDQIDKIKKIEEAYQDDVSEGMQNVNFNPQELQDLSDEERTKKFQEFREKRTAQTKKLTEKYQPKLEKALDSAQLARVKEIQRQWLGIMALRDKDTIKDLGLSDEQVDEIEAIFNEDRNARLLAVLSDEQKAKLDELKGKPFDLSQLRPRGFGGGRPGAPRERPPM